VVGSISPVATVSTLRLGSLTIGSPLPIEATTPGMFCCAYTRCDIGIRNTRAIGKGMAFLHKNKQKSNNDGLLKIKKYKLETLNIMI
jgi:hypothetical protein